MGLSALRPPAALERRAPSGACEPRHAHIQKRLSTSAKTHQQTTPTLARQRTRPPTGRRHAPRSAGFAPVSLACQPAPLPLARRARLETRAFAPSSVVARAPSRARGRRGPAGARATDRGASQAAAVCLRGPREGRGRHAPAAPRSAAGQRGPRGSTLCSLPRARAPRGVAGSAREPRGARWRACEAMDGEGGKGELLGDVVVGCSGWNYAHWRGGAFYPKARPRARPGSSVARRRSAAGGASPRPRGREKQSCSSMMSRAPGLSARLCLLIYRLHSLCALRATVYTAGRATSA